MTAWSERTLGELCALRAGIVFKPADQGLDFGDIPFIKVSDMNLASNSIAIREANNWVNGDYVARVRAKTFPAGTTVFAKIGEALRQNRVRKIVRPTLIDNNMMGAIPNFSVVLPEFLYYRLASFDIASTSTGTALPYLTVSTLERQRFRIPPLSVQRCIASILSAYDDLIENNSRRMAILEEMARRIYEEWFVRFRFPGHEGVRMVESELGLVPDSWCSQPLAAFGQVITGKTPSKGNPGFYGAAVPFLKTPDMHGNLFILATGECLSREGADSQRNKTIPARSLCVSCIGTIGVVSITTEACQTNQQINSLLPADAATLELLYFRLKDSKKTLENLGANGATMGNVNKSKFEALSVLTPAPDLLQVFHAAVAPMFALIEALARKNVNLRTTRGLLLPKLISGELDVSAMPEPEALAA